MVAVVMVAVMAAVMVAAATKTHIQHGGGNKNIQHRAFPRGGGNKNIQHRAFPRGPPPQYYLGLILLNCAVQMGSGDPE
jgi:hypothetical protein